MAERKAHLGRGLAELLGEASLGAVPEQAPLSEDISKPTDSGGALGTGTAPAAAPEAHHGVLDLPVTALRPNPRQPRRDMDLEGLQELAESMRSLGIVQPIIARLTDDGYEIIAGERRWRAAQLAGFSALPVIVREASDTESLEIALVENVVRRQLNPVDEAYALHVLLEDLGVTHEGLAARLGRSRPALTNKMRLLDLPAPVQELVAEGRLSEGHGRALLGLRSRGDQIRLAQKAVARGLSVRAVESEVKKMGSVQPSSTPTSEAIVISNDLIAEVKERFFELCGVSPRISLGPKGGKLEVPFRDEAELDRLLRRLAGE